MITIISATDRKNSNTLKVAMQYQDFLKTFNEDSEIVSLEGKRVDSRNDWMLEVERALLIPTKKFIFIMPEYNGSFPGVFKHFIDNTDITKAWWHKKVLLVGVADGRGGNLRGIEHMTNILHYLKMDVHYNKLPISKVNEELDENGLFKHEETVQAIHTQLKQYLKY